MNSTLKINLHFYCISMSTTSFQLQIKKYMFRMAIFNLKFILLTFYFVHFIDIDTSAP